MRGDRRRLVIALVVLALLAGLFATRLWRIDAASLWEDDYLNLDRALMPLGDMVAVQKWQGPADTIFDFQPPLVYGVQHLALAIHQSSLAARIPSLLAALLTPLGLWLLARRLFGPAVGLVTAVLSVFLLYPLGFAQAIKTYALFLCLAVYALWLVVRAVEKRTVWAWIAYGACSLAMLYAGYQALPAFAAQCLWAGLVLWRAPAGAAGAAGRRRRLAPLLVTCAAVGLAYLPWLPAVFFARTFLLDPAVHPWAGVNAAFAGKILRGLIALDPHLPLGYVIGWCAVLALGLGRCVFHRQWRGLWLLCLVAGITSLALVSSRSLLRSILEGRHFVMAFPAMVLFAACGVIGLRDVTARALSRFRFGSQGAVGFALVACLFLLWPSISAYPDFFGRSLSLDRDFFRWLDGVRGDVDAVNFHGYKRNTRRFALGWYLPGRFDEAGTFAAPGYRRIADIDTFYADEAARRPRLPGLPLRTFSWLFTSTRVTLAPAAGRAPLVMDPGPGGTWRYKDDFRDRRFYADALRAANTTLDTELGMLRPARYSRPASGTWAFEVPPGTTLAKLRLTVTAALFKRHPTVASDSDLVVAAGPDPAHLTDLGVIGQDAFPVKDGRPVTVPSAFFDEIGFYHDRCRKVAVDYAVPAGLAASGRIFVRVSYRPGHKEGFLNLAGLAVVADLSGTPAGQGKDSPLALQAGHLLANIQAARWREADGGTETGLFAFAAPGIPWLADVGLPVGTPAEAEVFRARHPALAPVATLADKDGHPALLVYDTAMASPGIKLSAATPGHTVSSLPDFGQAPVSLRLTGTIAIPTLRLGATSLTIPVLAPAGSTLTLTPGGKGRIVFAPDWTATPSRYSAAMSYTRDVTASKRTRGALTCGIDGNCAFSYTFVSALPMTELRLRAFPLVYANPCRKCEPNQARVSVSTDGGKTYRTLVDEKGGEECTWTPAGTSASRRLRFDPPVKTVIVAFQLQQGEQAGFLSPSWNVDDMYIEADLDARALPPLHLSGPDLKVSLADPGTNDFALFLRPGPWPLSSRTAQPEF
ncbi:MAG: glycosyltransferase family 39 protein [Desulfovibrio sp.]